MHPRRLTLLGREGEVAALGALLGEPDVRLVTLTGVGGVQDAKAADVCDLLGISEVNQRVLLHRARAKVRVALDDHLT